MAPQNGCGYYGVDLEECGGSHLTFPCELQGPLCCKPSSVVATPKSDSRSCIGVQIDVVWVCQMSWKKVIPFLLARRFSQRQSLAQLELSCEMELKSDGTEEAIDSKREIKARPWGMMHRVKLRWPQDVARRKL